MDLVLVTGGTAQLGPGPETQAEVLLGEVRRLGATGVAPMLDLEAPFHPDGAARNFGLAFCRHVAAAGFRPAVYMSASFASALRPDQDRRPRLAGDNAEVPASGSPVGGGCGGVAEQAPPIATISPAARCLISISGSSWTLRI
jgi:hypothetical protein